MHPQREDGMRAAAEAILQELEFDIDDLEEHLMVVSPFGCMCERDNLFCALDANLTEVANVEGYMFWHQAPESEIRLWATLSFRHDPNQWSGIDLFRNPGYPNCERGEGCRDEPSQQVRELLDEAIDNKVHDLVLSRQPLAITDRWGVM
jgi:hypothetical protein